MAVPYTNLFTVLGKYIKHINSYTTIISDIATDLNDIEAILNTAGLIHLAEDLAPTFYGFEDDVTGWIGTIKGRMEQIITERDFMLDTLPVAEGADVVEVLRELRRAMVTDDEDVLESTVSVGALTTSAENTTVGTAVGEATLDGVSSPDPTGAAPVVRRYASNSSPLTSQMARTTDVITLTCLADSEGGAAEGAEVFKINGGPLTSFYSRQEEQSGEGGSVQVATLQGVSVVPNGSFDAWDSTNPDSWTINTGAATTEFAKDTSDAFRGGNSLQVLTGGGGALNITTSVPSTLVIRGKLYLLGCWLKRAAGGTTPVGTLELNDGASNLGSLDVGAMTFDGTWGFGYAPIVIPNQITSSTLTVELDITTIGTANFNIEDIGLFEPKYFDGIAWAVLSGPEKFLVGDRLQRTITNDNAGVIQTAFRRLWGLQLRTINTGPSQADSLAT